MVGCWAVVRERWRTPPGGYNNYIERKVFVRGSAAADSAAITIIPLRYASTYASKVRREGG